MSEMTPSSLREKYQSGTVKPDYKDFGISENMYQKKYINKEEEPIPILGIHLISFILCSILVFFIYRHMSQNSHESWGVRDKWTSETSFYESLELIWEGWSNMGFFPGYFFNIFIFLCVYISIFLFLKEYLIKCELSWNPENFISYEFHLKEWERITLEKKEEEKEERKIEKERLKIQKEVERRMLKREKEVEQERLKKEKELEGLRKKQEYWFGLSGRETEVELDKVFEKLGYETVLTQTGSDEGLDHILNGEIVVQTKNEITKSTRPDLQRFWGSFKSSHKKGIFVSLRGFTKHCEEFVKDKPILLYDVDDVIGMSEGKTPEWDE